jgi:hypothetical protein
MEANEEIMNARWHNLLSMRSKRLARLVELKAPALIISMEVWLVFRAIHKDSFSSMFRSTIKWWLASAKANTLMFYRLRILRMDPEDDNTWR